MATEPTVFGRYQLLEPLAKGGMAEVFKAKLAAAAGAEKLVCIKRILPHLSRNQDFLSLFVREARIALPLNHGNITQVFDFGEEQGVYYLAMEYIAGRNLHQVLERVRELGSKLDVGASLHVAVEICKGLQYAHSFVGANGQTQAVVHRDVTPHNVLISYSGEVKLTDFGIALAATKVPGGEDGVIRGKACYLSPEQADGHPGMPASDIFSLGTVLYEMLTGRRVFAAETEGETLKRVRGLQVPHPSEDNPEVDAAIDEVVLRAMSRTPAERYARAGDLQVALTQILLRRWPEYTAASLAASMRDLFGWEMAQSDEGSPDPGRDHLLMQLSRAGVSVDAGKTSTAELLELGTVAIPSASASRRRTKRVFPLLVSGAVLLLGGAIAAFLLGRQPPAPPADDDGSEVLGGEYQGTEHLAPVSPEPKRPPPASPSSQPSVTSTGARVARKPAFLNCNSWPWSQVYVDGRLLRGNTPFFRVRVSPGRRQLRFFNPELGLSREVEVEVAPGEVRTVAVTLQQ